MLIQINNSWQNLNTLTGLSVGSGMLVQSQSSSRVYVKQQDTAPQDDSFDAALLEFKDIWVVESGSKTTWVKVADNAGQLFVEVE